MAVALSVGAVSASEKETKLKRTDETIAIEQKLSRVQVISKSFELRLVGPEGVAALTWICNGSACTCTEYDNADDPVMSDCGIGSEICGTGRDGPPDATCVDNGNGSRTCSCMRGGMPGRGLLGGRMPPLDFLRP